MSPQYFKICTELDFKNNLNMLYSTISTYSLFHALSVLVIFNIESHNFKRLSLYCHFQELLMQDAHKHNINMNHKNEDRSKAY